LADPLRISSDVTLELNADNRSTELEKIHGLGYGKNRMEDDEAPNMGAMLSDGAIGHETVGDETRDL